MWELLVVVVAEARCPLLWKLGACLGVLGEKGRDPGTVNLHVHLTCNLTTRADLAAEMTTMKAVKRCERFILGISVPSLILSHCGCTHTRRRHRMNGHSVNQIRS